MHAPSYAAKLAKVRKDAKTSIDVMLVEPVQSLPELLINVLDKIGEKKITFKYGIRVQETPHSQRQEVLYVIKNARSYSVCIKVNDDNVMRQVPDLSVAIINSILQRLRLEYGSKLKGKK